MAAARWTGFVIAMSLAGCSHSPGDVSGDVANAPAPLIQVNHLLHTTAVADGHPATQLSDLEKRRRLYPWGYDAVKNGDIVVLWGTRPKGEGATAAGGEEVVAYEKAVPTEGGYVLFSGGTIKKMTAAEFATAPKGGKAKG